MIPFRTHPDDITAGVTFRKNPVVAGGEASQESDAPAPAGLFVEKVSKDSLNFGLIFAGDLVLEVDSRPVESEEMFFFTLKECERKNQSPGLASVTAIVIEHAPYSVRY